MAFCLRQNMLIRKNVNPRQSDNNEKPLILGLLSRIICVNSTCTDIIAVIHLSYHNINLLPYQRELLNRKISQKSYSPVTGEFPHKGQWHGTLMLSLICAWINVWVNSREAGNLRRHCHHYDITAIVSDLLFQLNLHENVIFTFRAMGIRTT